MMEKTMDEKDENQKAECAKNGTFACPKCGTQLETGTDCCPECQTFLDPVTGQIRTDVSDEELHRNLKKGLQSLQTGRYKLIAGIIITVVGYWINGTIGTIIFIAGMFVIVMGGYAEMMAKEEYKTQLSQTVIPKVLAQVFDQVEEYNPKGHISNGIINSTHMFFPFDFHEIEGSDYVKASYKGVSLEMSDISLVKVKKERVENKNGVGHDEESRSRMFHGQWMIFDFHKDLSADLCVFEGGRKKGQIETENDAFNKKYGISCSSAHDAFYILTPHMMEGILAMDERAGGDTYMRFLRKGKVHLAINSGRDHFEVENMKNTSVDDFRKKFQDELKYVTDIVDLFLATDSMYVS